MVDDRRDDRGQFTPTYSEEEFLNAVSEYEPAGTSEVADAVNCTYQNADYRLRQLEEKGKVRSKKIGQSLVWMSTNS